MRVNVSFFVLFSQLIHLTLGGQILLTVKKRYNASANAKQVNAMVAEYNRMEAKYHQMGGQNFDVRIAQIQDMKQRCLDIVNLMQELTWKKKQVASANAVGNAVSTESLWCVEQEKMLQKAKLAWMDEQGIEVEDTLHSGHGIRRRKKGDTCSWVERLDDQYPRDTTAATVPLDLSPLTGGHKKKGQGTQGSTNLFTYPTTNGDMLFICKTDRSDMRAQTAHEQLVHKALQEHNKEQKQKLNQSTEQEDTIELQEETTDNSNDNDEEEVVEEPRGVTETEFITYKTLYEAARDENKPQRHLAEVYGWANIVRGDRIEDMMVMKYYNGGDGLNIGRKLRELTSNLMYDIPSDDDQKVQKQTAIMGKYVNAMKYMAKVLLESLEDMHKVGWAHNDMKPDNFMADGEDGSIILIDLGGASQCEEGETEDQGVKRRCDVPSAVTEEYANYEFYHAFQRAARKGGEPWMQDNFLGDVWAVGATMTHVIDRPAMKQKELEPPNGGWTAEGLKFFRAYPEASRQAGVDQFQTYIESLMPTDFEDTPLPTAALAAQALQNVDETLAKAFIKAAVTDSTADQFSQAGKAWVVEKDLNQVANSLWQWFRLIEENSKRTETDANGIAHMYGIFNDAHRKGDLIQVHKKGWENDHQTSTHAIATSYARIRSFYATWVQRQAEYEKWLEANVLKENKFWDTTNMKRKLFSSGGKVKGAAHLENEAYDRNLQLKDIGEPYTTMLDSTSKLAKKESQSVLLNEDKDTIVFKDDENDVQFAPPPNFLRINGLNEQTMYGPNGNLKSISDQPQINQEDSTDNEQDVITDNHSQKHVEFLQRHKTGIRIPHKAAHAARLSRSALSLAHDAGELNGPDDWSQDF
uniref:Protein kinase domain-containing protein n=1 Tax=Chromera velia CCMP2878 TaxID=1169474 RepID=A0A0G4FLU0_9ALVE|eukprot:Cvel_17513.t1-p1 / transcript=Cvel_17513.t1 / gene=Cvel_17513 / organism=Chromera_velia_CCMP2878 / gene_product=hypothetical protein / transcript_product=hypothetical protein / location=Cvel_scaffold1403:31205-35816(-) / protein_length=864 / sequence_SO=supercontig / SO=protein_coding / is_pseudo=false